MRPAGTSRARDRSGGAGGAGGGQRVPTPRLPAPGGEPPLARRLSRGERREHLLDVAADLVMGGGFESVTMEGVATRAGVSKGLGYAYFDNRDELLAALFDREMAALDRRVLRAATDASAAGGTFEHRLHAILDAGLDVVADRGVLIGTLLQAKPHEGPLEEKRRARQDVVERYFMQMVIDEYGVTQRAARTAVAILLGGYSGALELWVHRRVTRTEIANAFVSMALGGLGALSDGAVARPA